MINVVVPTTNTQTKPKAHRVAEACPACSHKLAFDVEGAARIYRCARCQGIYGTCYLGDSYALVLPYFVTEEIPAEKQRYFDFTCLGSKGVTRRHGWFDPETKRITQVG